VDVLKQLLASERGQFEELLNNRDFFSSFYLGMLVATDGILVRFGEREADRKARLRSTGLGIRLRKLIDLP
jgi:hypothetical protein